MDLSEDILRNIISYISTDITTISNLSVCNKYLLTICRKKWVWVDYYRSLFPTETKITKDSEHIGYVTYFNCRICEYPGWGSVFKPVYDKTCLNPNHYTKTKLSVKNIRWVNLFKMCAVRTHTLNISKNLWTYNDEQKLKYLNDELTILKIKKDKNTKFKNKFKLFIKKYNTK